MFCIVWLATIGTTLLPAKGMFVAALILWGGFGSLFTLAQRADAGRSVSTFVSTLQTALGAPLAVHLPDVGIPTAPNSASTTCLSATLSLSHSGRDLPRRYCGFLCRFRSPRLVAG